MDSFIRTHYSGVAHDCRAIYEVMRRGWKRQACRDETGTCMFRAQDGCLMTRRSHIEEPSCTASTWINAVGSDLSALNFSGSIQKKVSMFVERRIREITAASIDYFANAMAPERTESNRRSALEMGISTMLGEMTAAIKLMTEMTDAVSAKSIIAPEDIHEMLSNMHVPGGRTTSWANLEESITSLKKEVQIDAQPMANVSRKEVKRLRNRVQDLETRLQKICSVIGLEGESDPSKIADGILAGGSNGSDRQ